MGVGVDVNVGVGDAVNVGVGGTTLSTGLAPGVCTRTTLPGTTGCCPILKRTAPLTRNTNETSAKAALPINIGLRTSGRFGATGTRPRYIMTTAPLPPSTARNNARSTGPAYGQGS